MQIKKPRSQVDYMLRDTRSELVALSQMADIKANILLSISSVLITIALTQLTKPSMRLPIIILIMFLLFSIVAALLAVTPSMSLSRKQKISTIDSNFNTLFFGHYTSVPYDEYLEHMENVMNDHNRTYEVQVREISFSGQYLKKTKFNYIKYGYFFFLVGVISSVVLYIMGMI